MIELFAALFVFAALTAAAVAILGRARAAESSDDRLRALGPSAGDHEPDMASALSLRSGAGSLRGLLRNTSWAARTATDLRRANVKLRVGEYVLVRVLTAVMFSGVPLVLLRGGVAGFLLAFAGAVVGFWLPAVYLRIQRDKRLARIETQLTEFLPALAASLRSGFALAPAVESASQQVSAPLADELALLRNDLRFGADSANALAGLGERVGSRDLNVVITAIQVQRTTGGNLPEVLDAAATALRDRERIRGEVKTFTAQQRMTGTILSVYPVLVGLLLLAIMPSVWSKLFTEPAGQVQLTIAVVLQVVGFLAIRRAVRVEV